MILVYKARIYQGFNKGDEKKEFDLWSKHQRLAKDERPDR